MTLYSKLQTKLQTAALASEKLGEDLTYKPSGGSTRAIRGIVKRVDADQYGNTITPRTTVRVDNSATTGISDTELDCGADQISVAMQPGDTPTDRNIKRVISQSAVRLILEVM